MVEVRGAFLHYAKESHYCWYYFKGWLHHDFREEKRLPMLRYL